MHTTQCSKSVKNSAKINGLTIEGSMITSNPKFNDMLEKMSKNILFSEANSATSQNCIFFLDFRALWSNATSDGLGIRNGIFGYLESAEKWV